MAKIHGLAYILVGLFVSILSYRMNYEKLIFFFYTGMFFIIVGISKLVFGFIKRSTGRKSLQQEKFQHQAANQSKYQEHHYKRCHKCGSAVAFNSRFCSKCGAAV